MRLLPPFLACCILAVHSASSNQRVKWKISFGPKSNETGKPPSITFARVQDDNVNYPPILITCNEMECSEGFVCVDGRVSGPDEPIQPVEVFCRPAGATTCAVVKCSRETRCAHIEVCNGTTCTIEPRCVPNQVECGKDETYDSCGTCESTCENPNPICTADCNPARTGCKCTPSRVRHSQGMCVDLEECGITIAPTICNKTNEHWNGCGVCEQTCINQNVMCLTACLPERAGCQCNAGFVRNPEGDCVNSGECTYSTVPAPPKCRTNEHWDACGGCDGTCENPLVACPKICAADRATCRCDYPYVRDESGRCILVSDCPSGQPTTPTPSSEPNYNQRCEKLNCKEGTRCILEGSKMHCGVNANITCNCSPAERCILQVVQCVTTPCDPIPLCVSVCNCPSGTSCQYSSTGQQMCVQNGYNYNYCPPCMYGYSCQYYYGQYQCVPNNIGSPTAAPPCTLQCTGNQECQIVNGASQCVGPTPSPSCTFVCPAGQTCLVINGRESCATPLPTTTPTPTCTTVCSATTSCQVLNGVAACRALPTTPRPCTAACPVGQICLFITNKNTCVDDPAYFTTTPSPVGNNCTMPCPYGQICQLQNSYPTCVPQQQQQYCGPNAYMAQCGNLCEGKCQYVNSGPQACPMICGPAACACAQGFYRDPYSNQCVSPNQCQMSSNPNTNPCAYTSCAYMSTCVVQNGRASCVPYGNQGGYPGQTPYQTGYPYQTGNGYPTQTGYPGQSYPGQSYPGQTYPGQTYQGQSYPAQTYYGQTYPGQTSYNGQSYPGQTYPAQTYSGQSYPGQTYNGQAYPGQTSYNGQSYPGQTYNGQTYSGQSYPNQNGYSQYSSQYPYLTGGQTQFGKKK